MTEITDLLRVAVALVVVGLLGRAARPAWRHRSLAVAVWRQIRVRHLVGATLLLVLVLATAVTVMTLLPFTAFGLGSLVGLDGNAVFAPLQGASELTGNGAASVGAEGAGDGGGGPNWALLGLTAGFLGLLLLLFPWLAYVEERVFREGLEDADRRREAWTALRFGLVHLVMLIPLGAALGIAVAGFVYGRVYRTAYAQALRRPADVLTWTAEPGVVEPPARRARTEAVMATTVWHTAFNSLVVTLILVAYVVSALAA